MTQPDPGLTVALTKALVDQASELGLAWGLRLATITDGTDPNNVRAVMDGDTVDIRMISMIGRPLAVDGRVYVLSIPPAGQYIVGVVTQIGMGLISAEDGTNILGFIDTTYVDGTPVVGIAFLAPPSGAGLLIWGARLEPNTANRVTASAQIAEGDTIGSGNQVVSSTDSWAIETTTGIGTAGTFQASRVRPISGLTPHQWYNATIQHRITGGNGDIFDRDISWMPL